MRPGRLCLCSVMATLAAAQTSVQYGLRVNGNPVITTRPPVRIAAEWFVPLAPVARALGAEIRLDPAAQTLSVIRNSGATAIYDGATGRVLQGSVLAAQIAGFREVQLGIGLENIVFPLDGVVALFDVAVRENADEDVLEIDGNAAAASPSASGQSGVHLASLQDRYTFATNGAVWEQSLNLKADVLTPGLRLTGAADLSRIGSAFLGFRQGFVRVEAAGHRVITLGDQGAFTGVEALSNSLRGIGYERRWRGFQVQVYGGRAATSMSAALGSSGVAVYDSNIGGVNLRHLTHDTELSLGANAFGGGKRSGATIGAGYTGRYLRNTFRVQTVTGYFSGSSVRSALQLVDHPVVGANAPAMPATAETSFSSVLEVQQNAATVKGMGYGLSIADTFAPFANNRLNLTALWERYSRNFLVVREESRFSATSRKSVSANLRPLRYLNLSGSAQRNELLVGDPNPQAGFSWGGVISGPARLPLQAGYFRSTTTNAGSLGKLLLTQYSLQLPRLGRYSASATYSEIHIGGQTSQSIRENVTAEFRRYGRVGLHDQLQLKNNHTYGVDWSHHFGKETYVTAGLERQTFLTQKPAYSPAFALVVPLPHLQTLTMSYYRTGGTALFRIEIGGSLSRRREMVTLSNAQSAMIVPSSLDGQVYYDVNYDGQFKGGLDRPLADMKVWLDREVSTTTDGSGYFHFDGVTPGPHRVHVEVSNLAANLIFVTDDLKMAVVPFHANRQDFRAIPTGSMRGTVTIARLDDNGRRVVTPLPDVRLIATGNKDTFSEGDGTFVLGDLPPGNYQLRLDPSTIPAGFEATPAVRTMDIKPGQVTGSQNFLLERPVIVKPAPPRPDAAVRNGIPSAPQGKVL